jgi:hypothetical protein
MKKYDVIKASSPAELIIMVQERILTGLTALGSPAVIYMRNKRNNRIALYYQAVAVTERNR